jgi:hypothetical protein
MHAHYPVLYVQISCCFVITPSCFRGLSCFPLHDPPALRRCREDASDGAAQHGGRPLLWRNRLLRENAEGRGVARVVQGVSGRWTGSACAGTHARHPSLLPGAGWGREGWHVMCEQLVGGLPAAGFCRRGRVWGPGNSPSGLRMRSCERLVDCRLFDAEKCKEHSAKGPTLIERSARGPAIAT